MPRRFEKLQLAHRRQGAQGIRHSTHGEEILHAALCQAAQFQLQRGACLQVQATVDGHGARVAGITGPWEFAGDEVVQSRVMRSRTKRWPAVPAGTVACTRWMLSSSLVISSVTSSVCQSFGASVSLHST